ncbi:MAG: family N-acetyltransferase [Cryobacterium sp.]|jgi:predicted GNAT family acetyltransferase|nr:family N-acetyltransferase [Cryobacterium sp.]
MPVDDNPPPAGQSATGITVVHAPERSRYELHDGGRTIGFTVYRLSPTDQVVFTHTEVDDAYSGQGLASQLARFALDDVRASGRRIVPICPYIAAYLRKHHDYDDIVDLPRQREVRTG